MRHDQWLKMENEDNPEQSFDDWIRYCSHRHKESNQPTRDCSNSVSLSRLLSSPFFLSIQVSQTLVPFATDWTSKDPTLNPAGKLRAQVWNVRLISELHTCLIYFRGSIKRCSGFDSFHLIFFFYTWCKNWASFREKKIYKVSQKGTIYIIKLNFIQLNLIY